MKEKKVTVKQKKNESVEDFIDRVLDKQQKNTEVEAVFNNDITLTVNKSDNAQSIAGLYNDKLSQSVLSEDELVENYDEEKLIADIVENLIAQEESKNIEEQIVDNIIESNSSLKNEQGELSLEEVEITDEYLDDEEFEENIPDLSEDELVENISAALNEQADEYADEVLTEEELQENVPDEEELESDKTSRGIVDLESLDILADEATKMSIYRGIDQEQLDHVYVTYENLKNELAELRTRKDQEYVEKMQIIQDFAKDCSDTMKTTNQELEERKKVIASKLGEFEQIYDEYEHEKMQLEAALKDLQKSFEEDKEVQKFVGLLNSITENNSKINLTKLDGLKELVRIPEVQKKYSGKLKEIAKLKWNVEAYEEYIPEFANIEENDRLLEEWSAIDDKKVTVEQVSKKVQDFAKNILEGSKVDEQGQFTYSKEDDPEIIELKEKIEQTESFIKDMDKHPLTLKKEIAALMAEGKSPEVIKEKLDELTANITESEISVLYDRDKGTVRAVDELIDERKQEISALTEKLNTETYINEELVRLDADKLNDLKLKLETTEKEITLCDSLLDNEKEDKKLKEINKTISKYQKMVEKLKKDKNQFLILNPEADTTKFDEMITSCAESCRNFLTRKSELLAAKKQREIKRKANFYTQHKKEMLIEKKKQYEKEIADLEEKIERKKSLDLYVDEVSRYNDESRINVLSSEVEQLEETRDGVVLHKVEDIKKTILNKYQNIEETKTNEQESNNEKNIDESDNMMELDEYEEILDFRDIPKMLLEKIKSINFKKAAAVAIGTIAVAATVVTGAIKLKNSSDEKQPTNEGTKQETMFTEEDANKASETLGTKVAEIIENQEKQINEEEMQRTQSSEIKDNLNIIDYEKIATSVKNAESGNFINPNSLYEPSYENAELEQYEGNIYKIVNDGQTIGYTIDDSQEIGKTR